MPTIALPCGHHIAESELLIIAGRIAAEKRQTKAGGRNGGRPRTQPRCQCGKYLLARAPKGHEC